MVAGFGLRAQTHQDTTGRLLSADPLPCTEGAYVSSLTKRHLQIHITQMAEPVVLVLVLVLVVWDMRITWRSQLRLE